MPKEILDNRTSQAAEEMSRGSAVSIASRPVRVAIGKKFLMMQEALEQCADAWQDDEDGGGFHPMAKIAQEALDYDPLNPTGIPRQPYEP